ncbi:MAG: HPF/RaiA family ribosome-associated protein [Minisyncoccia bacterium]|jgi:ribosomal subunit interface protein
MNIRVKATNLSLNPSVSGYLEKRLAKIRKLVSRDPSVVCDVELSRTTDHHQKGDVFRAEIHIVGRGLDAYAAVMNEDLHLAVCGVRDEIVKEIRTGKKKHRSFIRRSGARVKAMMKGLWPWGERGWRRGRTRDDAL